ncbi:MAG: hypothetical protein J6J72_00160, partial [Tyzzerella sp.]|nr:hypothetical protein [Tyzzerella sp.]
DVLWSHNKTTGLASHSASILYASKGDTASGIGVSLWGSGTQLITRQRGSSWTDVVDHGMASGVDTSQPMRFKIRMDYVDSDLTDTDETTNDVSLNVWIEQNETEYHVVKDRIFTDMTNLGGYVEVISHGAEPTITCSNVAFEEEYLTFCDVGIADGTYSANEGVSTYTESLAGKTLVGEVSYELKPQSTVLMN